MVSNGSITGVIDWSGGAYGDPRYDVSLAIRPKPNVFVNERDKQIFFEGYGGTIIDKDDYNYFANGLYEFFNISMVMLKIMKEVLCMRAPFKSRQIFI